MTYRKNLIITISGGLLFFFFGATACSQKDDVQVIRELINEGAELAEEHDVGGIMELATEDVVALPGHYDRLAIKRIIFSAFMHYGKLKVLYPKPSVDLSTTDNSATCRTSTKSPGAGLKRWGKMPIYTRLSFSC